MLYSPYVAARLQTYTERGRTTLELLLAKLGIPLQQARSPYLCAWVEWNECARRAAQLLLRN